MKLTHVFSLFFLTSVLTFEAASGETTPPNEELQVPASEIQAVCSSFQGSDDLSKTLDGDPNSIWHSRWNEPEAYPYQLEFSFAQPEKLEKIWYLPRQDGSNGFILEYELWAKKTADSDWETVQHGTLANSGAAKFITFNPLECQALRLDVLKGAAGLGSAAEFIFYRCDPELEEINALFTDRSFSALKTGKKSKNPIKSRQELEEMLKNAQRNDLQEDLLLALALIRKPKDLNRRVIECAQRASADEECRWRGGGMPWCSYQPTGLAVDLGQKFTVYAEANPGDPMPTLVIWNPAESWNDRALIPLALGRNYLEAPRKGILYCENPYLPNQQSKAPVLHFENVTFLPLYRLGKTTPKEWSAMLREPNPIGFMELSSDHVLITASVKNMAQHLDSPKTLLTAYEYLMNRYSRLLGFSETAQKPPHCRPKCVAHLIEVDHSFMYATHYRTCYHKDSMKTVLNTKAFLTDGWGPWHEIGHIHQVPAYKFEGLGEVTVNLFSLEMQTSTGQKARIDEPEMKKKITEYFQKKERNFNEEGDVFMKLALFWQLRMAFGEEFYPQLHRYYREAALELPNDDAKIQAFIRATSQISGWNLEPFFAAWGLPTALETRTKIQKLKKLTQPIWLNLEFSKVPPKGVVGLATKKKSSSNRPKAGR